MKVREEIVKVEKVIEEEEKDGKTRFERETNKRLRGKA